MMTLSSERLRRAILALSVGVLCYFVYLFFFSGTIISDDERYIIDTTDTLVTQGDALPDETRADQSIYVVGSFLNQTAYLRGIQSTDVEPAQPFLAAPLYWIGYNLSNVGTIHTLFLFNPIVTALTVIVLFYYALDLGYGEKTALVGALLFGLTTIVVPYAQTFFREPLTTLNLFGAAFAWQRWRHRFIEADSKHWYWLGASVIVTVLALLSKEASILMLPALFVIAYPGSIAISQHRHLIIRIGIGLIVVALLFVGGIILYREQLVVLSGRYEIFQRFTSFIEGLPIAWIGLSGYLLSPGKSIWVFSPILFFSLASPALLPRDRWRESWLMLGLTLWFALVYAAVRGILWHGGSGWGARYMVPLTPFLMIAALPAIDHILNKAGAWIKALLVLLGLTGFLIQIGGVYVPLKAYYDHLQFYTGSPAWGYPAIWSFKWSQAVGSLRYTPQAVSSIVWFYEETNWLMVGLILFSMLIVGGIGIFATRRQEATQKQLLPLLLLIPILAMSLSYFAMRQAYDDPRYEGHRAELHEMRQYLAENAGDNDIIMLSSPTYVLYFMNHFKGDQSWFSLPYSPGERHSPEQDPEITSDLVEDLVSPLAVDILDSGLPYKLFYRGNPIWLIIDHSSFIEWSTRPIEWYMAKYSFPTPVAVDFAPNLRAVKYVPLNAPTSVKPEIAVDRYFGENIHLIGYDLVVDDWIIITDLSALKPGDNLGISLVWETLAYLDVDYTIAVHLISPDGQVVLQHDSMPQGGFLPTSGWVVGQPIRDNHGFIMPDVPPGDYLLTTAVYVSWPEFANLSLLGEDEVLLTLTTLTIVGE